MAVSVSFAFTVATGIAATKPTVYSSLPPVQESSAHRIHEAFNGRFTIQPVPARAQFVPAKLTKRTVPPYIREVGRVTIAAVADVNGRLRDPVVIESTNRRLNRMLRESIRHWVCEPARLHGLPVRTVTKSTIEIRFRRPIKIY